MEKLNRFTFMLNKWWDGEYIPYGKGGDQNPW